jgi:hypothetical protein
MIIKIKFFLFVLIFATLCAGVCMAAELKTGAYIEVVYSAINVNNKNLINDQNETNIAKFHNTSADVDFKLLIDENTQAYIKLDIDDFSGGTVNADSLLEEINFTLKNIGGIDLSAKIGKQEIPFGMDKDLGISDPYVHGGMSDSFLNGVGDFNNDGTTDTFPHFGEVDNRFAITLIATPIKNSPKFELCVFQNDRGQDYDDGDEPADDGLTQSYAIRLTSTRVPKLEARVSYVSMHKEEIDITAGKIDDSSALSVSFDYTLYPVQFYGEGIWGSNLNHDKDYDQDVFHVGLAYNLSEVTTIVCQYNKMANRNNSGAAEPELEKIALTPKYKLKSGVELALEYARETLDMDDTVRTKDVTADIFSAKAAYHF